MAVSSMSKARLSLVFLAILAFFSVGSLAQGEDPPPDEGSGGDPYDGGSGSSGASNTEEWNAYPSELGFASVPASVDPVETAVVTAPTIAWASPTYDYYSSSSYEYPLYTTSGDNGAAASSTALAFGGGDTAVGTAAASSTSVASEPSPAAAARGSTADGRVLAAAGLIGAAVAMF